MVKIITKIIMDTLKYYSYMQVRNLMTIDFEHYYVLCAPLMSDSTTVCLCAPLMSDSTTVCLCAPLMSDSTTVCLCAPLMSDSTSVRLQIHTFPVCQDGSYAQLFPPTAFVMNYGN